MKTFKRFCFALALVPITLLAVVLMVAGLIEWIIRGESLIQAWVDKMASKIFEYSQKL